ncbi:uncharacterized protein LOC129889282 isoform X2 [Solanum dulcamara]|uniref:uncharacterized protein LOC129889282 isoform X2 n=1 Tax=Solanum dulcamara TaxID=45834 RepID=UPI0024863354|nr:uncharacterized protein LOC129889282 isoform X2 [Solanum dulcamara]
MNDSDGFEMGVEGSGILKTASSPYKMTIGGFGSFLIANTSGNTASFLGHFDDRAFPKELEVHNNGSIFSPVVRALSDTKFTAELANIVDLWMVLPYHTLDIVSIVFVCVYKLVLVFATGSQYLYLVRELVHWNNAGQLGEAKNALTMVLFLIEYMGHIVNVCLDVFYITIDVFNGMQSRDIHGSRLRFMGEVALLPELLQHAYDLEQDARLCVAVF